MLLYNPFSGIYFTAVTVRILEPFTMALPRMRFSFKSQWISGVVLVLLLPGFAAQALAKPQIVASIKPLALIAQEVAGDLVEVDTLLPITASAHDYPLKMSDHRRLREAALVLWVGAELESFMARPLANLPAKRVMTIYELPGLFWPTPVEHDHAHTSVDDKHNHGNGDPHIWLDPRNAAVIARDLALRLGQILPASAPQFTRNALKFSETITQLDAHLAVQLRPVQAQGFVVYHEGYSHFVSRYGLHQLAYVTFTPERRPGAKHLQELQAVLAKEGRCIFLEPYHNNGALEQMAKSLEVGIGLLDPIGDHQVSSYQQLLEQLGASVLTCLTDGADRRAIHP